VGIFLLLLFYVVIFRSHLRNSGQIFTRVNFNNRYGASIEDQTTNHLTVPRITSKQEFKNTLKATDIDIRIEPLHSDDPGAALAAHTVGEEEEENLLSLPSCFMKISAASIHFLLQKELCRDLDEILRESSESEDVYYDFIAHLLGFLRVEYTDEGIQYTIGGAFHHPVYTSLPWPKEINCDCDGMNDREETTNESILRNGSEDEEAEENESQNISP
jgi:hypothetical protein